MTYCEVMQLMNSTP